MPQEQPRTTERLQLALRAARLGSWEFDLTTRTLVSSAQCKANHGFGPDDDMQLEAHIVPAVVESDRARFVATIEDAIASRGSFELEVSHRWPDGTLHRLFVAGQVVDGGVMVGVSLDVTERWEMMRALREREERLRENDRRKDEFLAVVAHELRSPLAGVMAGVELLQLQGLPPQEVRDTQARMRRQTQQLTRLVNDLLDVGRIEAGKLGLVRSRADLNELVRQAVDACQPAIDRHQLFVSIERPSGPLSLTCDPARIVQVASNLVQNAVKFTPTGKRIAVRTFADGERVCLSVRDEGVGIAPELVGRLFQRYSQLGVGDQTGLGIGLWLVKSLVELHGGTVEVRSDGPGTGSEFLVRLPGE